MKNFSNSHKAPRKKSRRPIKKKLSASSILAMAAAVLILCFGLPLLRFMFNGNGAERGSELPQMGFDRLGIDISHNNRSPILWDSLRVMINSRGQTTRDKSEAVRIYPVKFVFIKATEGAGMKDNAFAQNWASAGEGNITRGAYHFFRSSKDGRSQADNFISSVKDLRFSDLPPVLDIETIHMGCSRNTLNDRALEWLQCIEKHYGRKPIVYTSDYYAREILDPSITQNYPVWIAHYAVNEPDFKGWKYWQFTDKAVVYGIPGLVDLSLSR